MGRGAGARSARDVAVASARRGGSAGASGCTYLHEQDREDPYFVA